LSRTTSRHQVRPWLYVKTRLHDEPRAAQPVVRCIPQFQLDNFFSARNVVPILVEDSRNNCQLVVIAAFRLLEADRLYVQMSQYREPRLSFVFLEKLRLQFDR